MITARAAATFEPVGRSVATARAFVRDTLQGWGFADVVDDAVVLTSELVTNAVVHAGTAADVLCLRHDDGGPHRGRRPLPRARGAAAAPRRDRHRVPRPRGRPRTAPLRGPRRPLGRGVHPHPQARLVPARPARTRRRHPLRRPRRCRSPPCPLADSRVRVAVIQVDRDGTVTGWNEDADAPLRPPRRPRSSASRSATSPPGRRPPAPASASPRPCGSPAGRAPTACATPTAGSSPVYGSHLRVRDTDGAALHRLPAGARRRAGRPPDPAAHPRARTRCPPTATGTGGPLRGLHRLPRPRRPRRAAPAHRRTRPRHARRRRRLPAAGHRRRDRTGGPRLHRAALRPAALRPGPGRGRLGTVRLRPDARRPRGPDRRTRRGARCCPAPGCARWSPCRSRSRAG